MSVVEKISRYKLLSGADIRKLPDLKWRVKGVLPDTGLAGLYGPSGSGKSFLALDLGIKIAEGGSWFGCRVERAPVVYCVLEGEGGIKQRVQAWESSRGRGLPNDMFLVLQNFKLTDTKDVADLAAVVPKGAVVFIDTLNRAVEGVDENSSKDMGGILYAAKILQNAIKGLVVIVHHTGKDTGRGLRGHSSLVAALDASIEVKREGDYREWRVAKSKDGRDDMAHSFELKVQVVGRDDYGEEVTSCFVAGSGGTECILKQAVLPQGESQKAVYQAVLPMFSSEGVVGIEGMPCSRFCIQLARAVEVGREVLLTCEKGKRTNRCRSVIASMIKRGILGTDGTWLWVG